MIKAGGIGRALPKRIWTNKDLTRRHGVPLSCLEASGVRRRPLCSPGEDQVSLAADACRSALASARRSIEDVDLVISACAVPYQPIPGMAAIVMDRLGFADGRCEALDINTTCASFLSALDVAATFVEAGRHQNILVVSAEIASRGLPWATDPTTAAIFGDGAGAVLVSRGNSAIVARSFETHASSWDTCQIQSGGTRHDFRDQAPAFTSGTTFQMNGSRLFRITAERFPNFVSRLLDHAGWKPSDVDVVAPHQASPHALKHMIRACKFSAEQVIEIVETHGNMIAASLPVVLSRAAEEGRLRAGSRLLLLTTSAGVSFGGMAIQLGEDWA